MGIVSNTEITMDDTCERAHYYRFGMKIEPKFENLGQALQRGLVGHDALAEYYKSLKDGDSVNEAKEVCFSVIKREIMRIMNETPEELEMISQMVALRHLLDGYIEHYRVDTFKVLDIETFNRTSITDDIQYGMRLDLLVEMTSGLYRGEQVLVDHKFLYNFKTMAQLEMDGQLVKYMKTLRDNGFKVSRGMFNQIRYRQMKDMSPDKIFKREWSTPTKTQTETIWGEQRKKAIKLEQKKSLPLEEWDKEATRNLSPMICKWCYFQPVCYTEMSGGNITAKIAVDYQRNTYGYTKTTDLAVIGD
jgi:hypothetical protein